MDKNPMALIMLSPNGKTELATINFFNLGIFNLASEKRGTGQSQARRIVAELYCERMAFAYTPTK